MIRVAAAALALAAFAACTSPRHLQYDHGRAFTAVMTAQGDLSRPSAATAAYPLAGAEASAIRLNVTENASNEESGESDLSNKAGQN